MHGKASLNDTHKLRFPHYFQVTQRLLFSLSCIDSPTAVISYNGTMSMHGTQPLFLNFDDGARGPTITCSANGCPRPTVEWIRENGRGLPSGIVQQDAPSSSSNGEVATQLRWRRDMEFTDSGFYVCRAFSNGGTYNATLELLVQCKYTCSTVYHYESN